MKKLAIILGLAVCTMGYAQEETAKTDVKKETETLTVKVNDGKSVTEKKVKKTTEARTPIKLDESDKNMTNQKRVAVPTEVKVTESADLDGDNYFESMNTNTYFMSNNEKYTFNKNEKGFTYGNSQMRKPPMDAFKTESGDYFIIRGSDKNGIGYFGANDEFIVEYFDNDTQSVVKEVFSPMNK